MTKTMMTQQLLLVVLMLMVSKVMSDCTGVDLNSPSEVETDADLQVDCLATSIVVTIDLCVFKRMGYTEADFSLVGDSSVIGYDFTDCPDAFMTESTTGDVKTFTITGDLTACAATSSSDADNVVYTNAVRNVHYSGTDTIARRKNALFEFSCTYQRSYNLTAEVHVTPQVVAVEGTLLEETGDFSPTVQLCKDDTCSATYTNGESVNVLDTVYLVFQTAKDLNIQIIDIDATDTDVPESATESFEFVGAGCNKDDEATLTNNGEMKSLLEFPFFHWTADEDLEVYFHVAFELCDADVDTCNDPCTGKKRRRRAARIAFEDEKLITKTIGPFKTRVK